MWSWFLRKSGFIPDGDATGKREAALLLFVTALGLTIYAFAQGALLLEAATGVLSVLWVSALAAMAGAFKLEHDKQLIQTKTQRIEDHDGTQFTQ